MDDLYAKESSENTAKEMLREHFQSAGIPWDDDI